MGRNSFKAELEKKLKPDKSFSKLTSNPNFGYVIKSFEANQTSGISTGQYESKVENRILKPQTLQIPVPQASQFNLNNRKMSLQKSIIWAASTFLVAFVISLIYCLLTLALEWYIAISSSILFSFIIGVLATCSVKWRAIFSICIPEAFSKSGLIIATTILYWLAATGPLNNIIYNMGQVTGMVTCTQDLVKVQQAQFADAIKQANDETVRVLIKAVTKATQFGSGVEKAIEKVTKTITDIEDSFQKLSTDNLRQAKDNCNRDFGGALDQCSNKVNHAYQDCRSKLKIGRKKRSPQGIFNKIKNGLNRHVAKPIGDATNQVVGGSQNVFDQAVGGSQHVFNQATTEICEVMQVGKICSSVKSVDICNSMFQGLALLTDKLKLGGFLTDFRNMFSIKINHEKLTGGSVMSSVNMTEIKVTIQKEIDDKLETATMIHSIIRGFIPLTILLLFFKAWMFNKKYFQNLNSPNVKIVKKLEKEKNKVGFVPSLRVAMISVLIPLLTFGPILIFEYTLAQALFFVGDNLNGTFSISGRLDFVAKVEGGIIMMPIFQQLLNDVQLESNYEFESSNEDCLPNTRESSSLFTVIAFGIIIVLMGFLSFAGQYLLVYRVKILNWAYQNGK